MSGAAYSYRVWHHASLSVHVGNSFRVWIDGSALGRGDRKRRDRRRVDRCYSFTQHISRSTNRTSVSTERSVFHPFVCRISVDATIPNKYKAPNPWRTQVEGKGGRKRGGTGGLLHTHSPNAFHAVEGGNLAEDVLRNLIVHVHGRECHLAAPLSAEGEGPDVDVGVGEQSAHRG